MKSDKNNIRSFRRSSCRSIRSFVCTDKGDKTRKKLLIKAMIMLKLKDKLDNILGTITQNMKNLDRR
jgi:hypothetical protein